MHVARDAHRLWARIAYKRALDERLKSRSTPFGVRRRQLRWDFLYIHHQTASVKPANEWPEGGDTIQRVGEFAGDPLEFGAPDELVLREAFRHFFRDVEDIPRFRLLRQYRDTGPLRLAMIESFLRLGFSRFLDPSNPIEEYVALPPALGAPASVQLLISLAVSGLHVSNDGLRRFAVNEGIALVESAGMVDESAAMIVRLGIDYLLDIGLIDEAERRCEQVLTTWGFPLDTVASGQKVPCELLKGATVQQLKGWLGLLPRMIDICRHKGPDYFEAGYRIFAAAALIENEVEALEPFWQRPRTVTW